MRSSSAIVASSSVPRASVAIPFPLMAQSIQPIRDPSCHPVFQVIFNLLGQSSLGSIDSLLDGTANETPMDFGPFKLKPFNIPQQEGQFDLALEMMYSDETLMASFRYCTDIFDAATIARMGQQYRCLLAHIVDNPDRHVWDLPLNSDTGCRHFLEMVLGHDRPVVIAAAIAAGLREAVLARLDDFHRARPQAGGIGIATLRKELAPYLPVDAFLFLLRQLVDARQIEVSRSEARRAGHSFSLTAHEQVLWERMLPVLIERGASPPTIEELASDLRVTPRIVLDLMHRLRKAGQAWQATETRFYAAPTIAALAATAAAVADASPSGEFTAAQFRDAIGTGRGIAIHILELFDRIGVTLRMGDRRRMQADFTTIVGAGNPLPRAAQARDGGLIA